VLSGSAARLRGFELSRYKTPAGPAPPLPDRISARKVRHNRHRDLTDGLSIWEMAHKIVTPEII